MKKPIINFAFVIATAGIIFLGCQSHETKVENAQEKVLESEAKMIEAQQDLEKATSDSIAEYKREVRDKIVAHEKSIAEFKARQAKNKSVNKAEYDKKLGELERQNSDFKKRLDDFKANGKEDWKNFKSDFNHEMEEFEEKIKNLR